jgi:hypothetical protein
MFSFEGWKLPLYLNFLLRCSLRDKITINVPLFKKHEKNLDTNPDPPFQQEVFILIRFAL